MSEPTKATQKRKREEEEKSENPIDPKTSKTKDDLTRGEPLMTIPPVTYTWELPKDELIGLAVGVLQEHEILEVDQDSGRMYLTPEKLPPTPQAPHKAEVFLPSPNTRFGQQNRVKQTLNFGEEMQPIPIMNPQEDAQDEEEQARHELDRIDTTTFDVEKEYDAEEPNYIARAARAIIDGLVNDKPKNKQWYMEQALKALIGNGSIEQLRDRLEDECDTTWDLGTPAH